MNADLVERIKERLGPDGYLNNRVLATAILGAEVALEYAAQQHEDVDSHCDHEPEAGAGAMGAVIRYRERIRALKA